MRKNLKKVMACTLSASMLATGVSGVSELGELVHKSKVVYAATTKNIVSGECGEKATWEYDTKTKVLTISGSGIVNDQLVGEDEDEEGNYEFVDRRPWKKYKEDIEKVVVGNDITAIGESVFWGCTSLKTAELGENIKIIDSEAFYGCTALEEINIKQAEKIESYAFGNCESLKSVTIGKSLKTMQNGAFAGCIGLEKIEIDPANEYFMMKDNNLVNKKETIWYACCFGSETTCHISDNINTIDPIILQSVSTIENFEVSSENKVFSSKDGLLYSKDGTELYLCPLGKKGTVIVQDATTTIGDYSRTIFENCAEIEKIVLGKNVKSLEFNMEGCTKLKEIEVSEENPYYSSAKGSLLSKDGKILLYCVSTDNGTYKIPDGVEIIDDFAFYRSHTNSYSPDEPNILIEHIIFPDSLEQGRLDDGDGDVWIKFKGVKTITLGAKYYDGKKLRWLIEFMDKTNLEAVYVSEENPYYSSVDGILYDKKQTKLMFCPIKAKTCKMPNTVKKIYDKAFYGEPEDNCLEEISVSDAIEDMSGAEWIFGWKLKKLSIGKKVNDINTKMYAKNLEELTVSSKNKTYKTVDNILYTKNGKKLLYCPKTTSGGVIVADGTTTIGASAFSVCKKVTEITLPASVKKIGKKAFKRISNNAVFKVPAGKKKYFKKLLTSTTGFEGNMTIKEIK